MPEWLLITIYVLCGILATIFITLPIFIGFILLIVKLFTRKKEGRRLRTLPAMSRAMPYIMKHRSDALNYISDSIDISAAEEYIKKKRAEGNKSFGIMHLLLAAYVRVVSEKPGVNRYVRGQEIWARNDIQIMLTIKKEMALDSPDTVIKIFPKPTDTPLDIYRQIDKLIVDNKKADNNGFDKTAGLLSALPGFLFRYVVWLLFTYDYLNLLPYGLTTYISPFHGSLFVTSMGSLGIPPIYHHIYNFGTVPVFLSFGTKYKKMHIDNNGNIKERRMIDVKFVTDERVCDGFYYASVFKTMKKYLKNPEKLDTPPEVVAEDVK